MKNVAMYLRLSLSDADLGENGKDESNSIENQRLLIRSYLTAHPEIFGTVVEYKDDGYTGLNFNRPAFRQMINDAKKGYISTIIVKDLSRFGRDYIGMGDYLEQILPSIGVRLIAINSRYDSAEQGANIVSLDISISNMINNMYSKDISKKLRSSFIAKWNQGINTGRSVPYGYTTDKNDPTYTPVIDEEAADIVRRIFNLAVQGHSTKEIAEYLNERNIMTPMVYNQARFGRKISKSTCSHDELLWNTHIVAGIIKRIDYTGVRTHGKKEHIGVGLGKTRTKGERDWIVVENNHEPIVSREIFELAQLSLRRQRFRTKCNGKNYDLLSGRVRCGCCGHLLQFIDDNQLYCQHAMDVGSKSKCNRDFYDATAIRGALIKAIRTQLELMENINQELKIRAENIVPTEKATLQDLNSQMKSLNDDFVRQYENYVNGNISRDAFLMHKERIASERSKIETIIAETEKNRAEEDAVYFEMDRVVSIGKAIKSYRHISPELLDALVEDVRINSSGGLEIRFKFEDLYSASLKILGMA